MVERKQVMKEELKEEEKIGYKVKNENHINNLQKQKMQDFNFTLPAKSKCIIIAIKDSYNNFEGANPIVETHNDAKKLYKLIKQENELVD